MGDLGAAAAIALAVIFTWAGAAKIARPQSTAASFSALGLPYAATLALGVPIFELAAAALLIVVPVPGATVALLLLGAFSVVLAQALRAGVAAGCACFGSARTDPISPLDLVRNAMLGVLGVAALAASGWPDPWAALAVFALVLVGGAGLRVARRRRGASSRPSPAVPGGEGRGRS